MKLDLTQLENEAVAEAALEPFVLTLKDGTDVNLPHPEDLDFEDLMNFDMDRPGLVLKTLMGEDNFTKFTEGGVKLRTLKAIIERYNEHFGLTKPGEAGASPSTARGSARPSRRTSESRRQGKAS